MTLTRRMDTPERRRFWKELEEMAQEAKKLPDWMRGKGLPTHKERVEPKP